jgi:hypothetical protein
MNKKGGYFMIKTKLVLSVMLLILLSVTSYADDTPKIVIDGMEAYKTAGFGGAFDIWLKGSPMENDKTTTMNLKGGFTQIESIYGKMISYEILKNIKISSSSNRIYAEIRYEKGPIFMFFDCYNSSKGWIIPTMKLHTDADKILPYDVFQIK